GHTLDYGEHACRFFGDHAAESGAMKAVLATCIAGAIAFTGMIWLVGGYTPGAAAPDVMRDVSVRLEPAVPGRFPIPGFPNSRASLLKFLRQGTASDAGAGKAVVPALAAAVPETPLEATSSLGSVP